MQMLLHLSLNLNKQNFVLFAITHCVFFSSYMRDADLILGSKLCDLQLNGSFLFLLLLLFHDLCVSRRFENILCMC